MNILHLWFLLALALPLVWTADDKLICTFPNQMAGRLTFMKEHNGAFPLSKDFNFGMDLQTQVVRLISWRTGKTYFLDFKNMTMYIYTSSPFSDRKSPNCRTAPLPEWMKFPRGVPSGLEVKRKIDKFGRSSDLYDTYTNNNESATPIVPIWKYAIYEVKQNTDPCQVDYYFDISEIDSMWKRIYILNVASYALDSPSAFNLPSTIGQCTPGTFPW